MAQYDKADLERRMAGAVEALKHDLSGLGQLEQAFRQLLDALAVAGEGSEQVFFTRRPRAEVRLQRFSGDGILGRAAVDRCRAGQPQAGRAVGRIGARKRDSGHGVPLVRSTNE